MKQENQGGGNPKKNWQDEVKTKQYAVKKNKQKTKTHTHTHKKRVNDEIKNIPWDTQQ